MKPHRLGRRAAAALLLAGASLPVCRAQAVAPASSAAAALSAQAATPAAGNGPPAATLAPSSATRDARRADDASAAPAASASSTAPARAAAPGAIAPSAFLGTDGAPRSAAAANASPALRGVGSAVPTLGAGSLLQTLFGLALVIGAVFVCGWIAPRLNRPGGARGAPLIKVVGGAALGARERVSVVEIDGTWLVLGVATGQVSLLHTLPAPPAGAPSDSAPNPHPSFSEAFMRQLRERLGRGARSN